VFRGKKKSRRAAAAEWTRNGMVSTGFARLCGFSDWNTVVKMSMPYHDRRVRRGMSAPTACGANVGLTLQANRQAVQDASCACAGWSKKVYKIGILEQVLDRPVGYITMVHDAGVHAGGFFHVSTYFADVVSAGMTTNTLGKHARARLLWTSCASIGRH